MIGRVLRFVRLPMLLILIYAIGRFTLGAQNVPYSPRGNAIFSVLGSAIVSAFYYGALSKKIGGFGWGGTLLTGYTIGLIAQIYIFIATGLSYALGIETSYFRHWDSLNVAQGTVVPMAQAMSSRALGLLFGPITPTIACVIGRAIGSGLAPDKTA
jgi:hypothetical protein